MKVRYKYFVIGAIFGLMFPVGAALFEFITLKLEWTFLNFILIHRQNKLLFMIDSAPVWLGLFALLGGISKERSLQLLSEFKYISENLSVNSTQLNSESKNVLSDISSTMEEIGSNYTGIADANKTMNTQVNLILEKLDALNKDWQELFLILNQLGETTKRFRHGNEEIYKGLQNYIVKVEAMSSAFRIMGDIGRQIDLLSLNSSIEASKYGEYGKSFAVVANNIRQLALSSKETNKNVAELVKAIEKDTSGLKTLLDDENSRIGTFSDSFETMNQFMTSFRDSLENFSMTLERITHTSKNQDIEISQFEHNLNDISVANKQMIRNLELLVNNEVSMINKLELIKQKA